VGLGESYLRRPTDQRAWLMGAAAGVLILPFIGAALATVDALKLTFEPNFLLMIGNAFSNFYEEYIYRGTLLAILMKYLGNKSVAIAVSALVLVEPLCHGLHRRQHLRRRCVMTGLRGSSEMSDYEPWPVERGRGSAASLRARGTWARRSTARCKSSAAI